MSSRLHAGHNADGVRRRPPIQRNQREQPRKWKTRPGGQPDGSSHMGAWGGWALAPNTASMGRDFTAPTYIWSRRVAERSNGLQFFYCAAGRLASRTAALSEA